ncbi:MAG: NADPH:quinone reductase [Verrucomicrobia bacterium]|nr:NADPH:quinone reductase [Verrucomicrobiota bacterium]
MKAIRVHQFGGPEVLRLEEIPTPQPGAGQLLLRVHAAGVNPVDTYFRSGTNPAIKPPYTPGLDAAGTVETVGEGVSTFRAGDRAYAGGAITGTYAEFAVCDAARVYRLPDNVTFAQGAGLHVPYATAHRALFHRAQARAGETVLIHGASGGVGLAAVQFARAVGLNVIGTAGTDEGRRLVLEQGAHHVLNHRVEGYLDNVLKLTGGRGVDVILEMLSNVNLGKDLPVLAPNGRVIVIGSRGKVEILPRDLMSRDADVRGMTLFNCTTAELAGIHAAIFAGLGNGTLRPIVGKQLPLADAAKAHVAVLEPGAYGKIVLVP